MLLAIIALGCAALIGFAAHRASLCNVRAVAELMTAGSAHMLWSLLQAMLWTTMLTGVLVLVFRLEPQPAWTRTPLPWAWPADCCSARARPSTVAARCPR